MRESGVMRYELWGGGEDEWRAKMKARKGFLIFYCALLCEPGELSVSCEINFLLNYKSWKKEGEADPRERRSKQTLCKCVLSPMIQEIFN